MHGRLPTRRFVIIEVQASKLYPAAWLLPLHAGAWRTQALPLPLPVGETALLLQPCSLHVGCRLVIQLPRGFLLHVGSRFLALLQRLRRWRLQRRMLLRQLLGWHLGSTAASGSRGTIPARASQGLHARLPALQGCTHAGCADLQRRSQHVERRVQGGTASKESTKRPYRMPTAQPSAHSSHTVSRKPPSAVGAA